MTTPARDHLGRQLLSDEEFGRLRRLDLAAHAALPADVQARFRYTVEYHAGERQKMYFDGMTVGDQNVDEILALRQSKQGQGQQPPAMPMP
jgi:hypothetical protein